MTSTTECGYSRSQKVCVQLQQLSSRVLSFNGHTRKLKLNGMDLFSSLQSKKPGVSCESTGMGEGVCDTMDSFSLACDIGKYGKRKTLSKHFEQPANISCTPCNSGKYGNTFGDSKDIACPNNCPAGKTGIADGESTWVRRR